MLCCKLWNMRMKEEIGIFLQISKDVDSVLDISRLKRMVNTIMLFGTVVQRNSYSFLDMRCFEMSPFLKDFSLTL